MTARDLVFSPDRRLRAPFAIGSFLALAMFGLVVAGLASAPAGGGLPRMAVFSGAATLALWMAHLVLVRQVEGAPWRSVWLDRAALAWRPVGLALALGAGAIAGPAAVLLGAGWLEAVPSSGGAGAWLRYAAMTLAVLVPAAAWEELAFRGYLLRVLRDAAGPWVAVTVTGLAFGLVHAGNVATVQPMALALVAVAGIFLGWIVLATGSLYAGIAAHLAWNAVLVVVLHAEVSGATLGAAPVYRVVDAGPDWATGGVWGPEGGLAAGVGLVAALGLLIARPRGREER